MNAWTASESDFDQNLIIDLGTVKNVTRIWTQGRAHSQEFVQEYHISYGSNGLDFVGYKAAGGEIKVSTNSQNNLLTNGEIIKHFSRHVACFVLHGFDSTLCVFAFCVDIFILDFYLLYFVLLIT